MPKDQISQTPNPTLFAEDSLVSRSHRQEDNAPKTTPAISGQKCLELSGSSGPLGLLERTLLGSSNWAWTKYSLTWKPKATPQGRLIFQLARLAPRTSDNESGLLHTPTAKANQTSPSMVGRGQGNWVSSLGGAKPHHMVPTPTTIERKSTNLTPSTGKLNYETNKSVSLDRWARMWPTPGAWEKGGGEYQDPEKIRARMEKGHQTNLAEAVKSDMWPTPTSSEGTGAQKNIGRTGGRSLRETVQMFPTPTVQDSANNGGPSQFKRNSLPLNAQVHVTPETDQKMWQTPMVDDARGGGSMKSRHIKLHQQVKMWPTPTQDSASNRTKKYGQGGTPLPLALQLADPKTTGSLNPQWVAWLMGYPTDRKSVV